MPIRTPVVAATALVSCALAIAQSDISVKSTEVVPGLFMLEGEGGFAGGNMGLLVGEDGVVLIDDGLEPLAPQLIAAIEEHTPQPVDFVINTHVHGDHVGANKALHMKGATVVAHDNIRKHMLDVGWQTRDGYRPAVKGELPEITFSDSVSFHLNGHEALVFHLAKAHTSGDSAIHFRGVDVIHSGDVFFNGMFPFVDLDGGGSVAGFQAAQQRLINMAGPDTVIIPGHGPLASRDDLQKALNMLIDAEARVKALVDAGQSEDEVVESNPLERYHDDWNWSFITTERMTRTLYRSLTSQ